MATIAGSHVTSGEDTSGGTSTVTASVTCSIGKTYFLAVRSGRSTAAAANTPTVTGASQTWAQVLTINPSDNSSRRRLTVFRCQPTSAGTGALTIDFAGQAQNPVEYSLDAFTNAAGGSNGANAVVQTVTDSWNTTNASETLALSAFAQTGNATYAVMWKSGANAPTAKAGFTEFVNFPTTMEVEFKASNDTSPSWTWSSEANIGIAAAIEIALAGAYPTVATATAAAPSPKVTIKPNAGIAAATAAAYNPTVVFVAPPRTVTINGSDYTGMINLDSFSLTECANRGEVGTGGFDVYDGSNALSIPALKPILFTDPSAGSSNSRIYTGFIHDRTTQALQDAALTARLWAVETTDLNILASDYVLTDADSANRPAETDYARIVWLLTTVFGSTGSISSGVVPNSNTVTMDARDYRGTSPADVLAECSEAAGKLWFIYDYGSGRKLYYDVATGTSLSSTAYLSDKSGDPDGSTVFKVIDVSVKMSPDRVYSKVHYTYQGGTVTVSNATTATNYRTREIAILDSVVSDSTLATAKANAILNGAVAELTEVDGLTTVLPAAHVNDIRAGQRVQIKLTRNGISSYTYFRVIGRTIQPMNGGTSVNGDALYYQVSFALASDVLASANGGRGRDDVPQNLSNANDDGATVIVDRGGITVTGGAITVTNGSSIVIIDGSSDMFKIAATGTTTSAAVTGQTLDNSVSVTAALSGYTANPAHMEFLSFGGAGPYAPSIPYTDWDNSTGKFKSSIYIASYYDASHAYLYFFSYCTTGNSFGAKSVRYYILQEAAV